MRELLHKAQQQLEDGLPFACYRKPNSDLMVGYFQSDATLHHADFSQPGFVFAPFKGDAAVLLPKQQCSVVLADWKADDVGNAHGFPTTDSGRSDFENLVKKGIHAIENGQFQKVVLSRKEVVAVGDFDAIGTFQKLASAYPTAFAYCFYHPKIGLWLGATPEQLLKVNTGRFETMALAGTQKFEGDTNVIWESKEKEEQQFVTDFIMENLESVTADIAFSNPYTYQAGNLLHLKTDISGTLVDASNIKHLLSILHPTPAVCGLPKQEALDFILTHEGYDRKFYSGYMGELEADFYHEDRITDLFVNLRCMEIVEKAAHLYIGCGVTKYSDPEKEYIETVNKSMTIKKIL